MNARLDGGAAGELLELDTSFLLRGNPEPEPMVIAQDSTLNRHAVLGRLDPDYIPRRTRFIRGLGNMAMMIGIWTSSIDLSVSCPANQVVADAGLESQLPGPKNASLLKLSTFNTHQSTGGEQEVIDAIKAQKSDLVALQEVNLETLPRIESETGYSSALFGFAKNGKGGGYGLAILTDLPVIDKATYAIENDPELERRVVLVSVVDFYGQPLVFATTHTINKEPGIGGESRNTERIKQIISLMDVLARPEYANLPQIVAGDWNAQINDTSRQILEFKYTYAPGLLGVHSMETFPWDNTEKDAVYFSSSSDMQPVTVRLWDGKSDHCGQTVEMFVPDK